MRYCNLEQEFKQCDSLDGLKEILNEYVRQQYPNHPSDHFEICFHGFHRSGRCLLLVSAIYSDTFSLLGPKHRLEYIAFMLKEHNMHYVFESGQFIGGEQDARKLYRKNYSLGFSKEQMPELYALARLMG